MNQHRPPNDEDSNHNNNQGRHGLNEGSDDNDDDDNSTVDSALKSRRRRSDSPPPSILSMASISTSGTTSLASLTPRNNRLPPSALHPQGTVHHPAFAPSTKAPSSVQNTHTTMQRRRRSSSMTSERDLVRLRRQVQALLLVVVGSVGMFLWFCLPVMGLVALALLGGSLGGTGVMVYRWGQAWVQYTLQHGGGVLQYLPPSIQTALTETTLHEWMIDDTAALEYRFLMLYFIPGLSPSQIDSLVNRLPSRHRNILRRPGLGHFLFNDQTMSNLIGNNTPSPTSQPSTIQPLSIMDDQNDALLLEDDPRDDVGGGADATNDLDWGEEEEEDERLPMRSFTAGEITTQTTSTTRVPTARTRPQLQRHDNANHLEEDDHSELGLSVSAETAVGEPSRQRRRRRTHLVGGASSRSLLTGLVPDFDFTDEVEQEGDVLSDAMTVAVTSMISTAASTVLQGLDTVVDTILAPALIRAGTSLSLIAAGVGVWRFQLLAPNHAHQPMTRPSQQWMYGWIGSMVVGGATAGGMMLARRAIRRAAQASRAATNTDDDIDDETSMQKDFNATTKEQSTSMHKKK